MHRRQAQAQQTKIALHTLGWKSFQDLCAQVLEDTLRCVVEVFREAQDGGQDAVFLHRPKKEGDYKQGTAQCKFYGKADALLKFSDIINEFKAVTALVQDGQAEVYIFMTNARVNAPIAIKIKKKLREIGVLKPHIFGNEFFDLVIRASPRLRALVPRIYGLGDLSQIVDERVASQTAALLGHMMPTLKVYVATQAHHKAVRSLRDFGITMLLGNPATGKSSIAAILSTIALENPKHRCFKVESPTELIARWNPNESGGFYWIDDAFGPNSLKDDFIDTWMMVLPKIQAAVSAGNQFVLTSRLHIYEAAKRKIGQRNHPRFLDGKAIVNVDIISKEERAQIMYNHVKTGDQPSIFKSAIKRTQDDSSIWISPRKSAEDSHREFLLEDCIRI